MACSMVLAVFNVNKVSRNGIAVEPMAGQTTGTVSQTLPFECTLTPRSLHSISLIGETV
ncbi:hypothetical protein C8R46DRAFT_1107891 [Mycena filopes]|nr:hypothetical protein C8R46DRAFT_1107891 [Mycena filopes]